MKSRSFTPNCYTEEIPSEMMASIEELPFKTLDGNFQLPIPVPNSPPNVTNERKVEFASLPEEDIFLPPIDVPEENSLFHAITLPLAHQGEKPQKPENHTCHCSLSKNSLSKCLPDSFFQPGNMSLIVLGISWQEMGLESPVSPCYVSNSELGELQCKISIVKEDKSLATLHIPTKNIFLLRKQIKANFSRLADKEVNSKPNTFNGRFKTASKHHQGIVTTYDNWNLCKQLAFQQNNEISLINVSILLDSKRKESLHLKDYTCFGLFFCPQIPTQNQIKPPKKQKRESNSPPNKKPKSGLY